MGEEHARSFLSFRARNLLQIGPLHLRRFFVLVRIYQTRTPRYPDFLERSRHSRPPRALSSDPCFRETKIIKFINPKTTRKSISNKQKNTKEKFNLLCQTKIITTKTDDKFKLFQRSRKISMSYC